MQPKDPVPPRPPSPQRPVMDIMGKPRVLQPTRPVPGTALPLVTPPVEPEPELPPAKAMDVTSPSQKPKRSLKKWILAIMSLLFIILPIAGYFGATAWYDAQLKPVTTDKNAARIRITIEPGSTPEMIADQLKQKGLIRDTFAFLFYTRQEGVQGKLQAGTFNLKPTDSLQDIVKHIVAGITDEFNLTFLPGDTIAGHKKQLIKAGYSEQEVETAFSKQYDHPVLAGKPASADLEGYIFGETYRFTGGATVEQILMRSFDELKKQIDANNLVSAYQQKGLNLYQGITLASIVQREVADIADSKQVAQVFLKRLSDDFPLGADATFVYAAKKVGATPSVDFDSPYNTRIHKGLPPGPISSPGATALQAVGAPAPGDFMYFVSGDDGRTHFSRTLAEHEALTAEYCKKNCSLF